MVEFISDYWYAIGGTLIGIFAFAWFWRSMRFPENRRKFWRTAGIAIVITFVGGTVAFVWVINSDAYGVAKAYVTHAPEATARFGTVAKVSMRSFQLGSDDARGSFSVEGDKAIGVLTLFLKKDPAWRVVRVENSD